MTRALDGLRVLDLSRVLAGPLCTQMLADHGAEVTKVESPAGDETRGWGPPFLETGVSAYYRNVNRAKRNLVLDLGSARGREVLGTLLSGADVVVENFKAGTLARWGFGDDELRRRFPSLVHCRITGFGTDGPLGGLPGYDAVLQAYGGLMSVNGEPDGPPLRVGVPVVDMVTGILAFSGILLALRERDASGLGQLVDLTLLDTVISLLHPHSGAWLADGTPGRRTGSAHPSIAPYENFETVDGPFFIGAGNDRQFAALAEVLGMPELASDPRFTSNADRVRNAAVLRAVLGPRIAARRREELAECLLARGVPASPVHDVADALTAPQVRHREMVIDREDGYRGVGIPIKLARTPGQVGAAPRPPGADTRAVLAVAGYSDDEIDSLLADGTAVSSGGDPSGGSA
ncbi:CaiB/BaiF CoA transferase family protein [Amycolatopsis albispora]|uniref:Carnitine dehydratase n=1 Tax=Amycolatopsis albispora TaxID=1804986 RepID=A0A344L399_9PSEU|nr:CoA transferase [Amycolatopsis albispora]AXB42523.1 carnitine dehydratase [Amycolatopsis albispora]